MFWSSTLDFALRTGLFLYNLACTACTWIIFPSGSSKDLASSSPLSDLRAAQGTRGTCWNSGKGVQRCAKGIPTITGSHCCSKSCLDMLGVFINLRDRHPICRRGSSSYEFPPAIFSSGTFTYAKQGTKHPKHLGCRTDPKVQHPNTLTSINPSIHLMTTYDNWMVQQL